ncbi:MAG: SDR family NAD(P)-dependent oxidoreductase [Planctomycetes bacterium]|nr:SDR family NAD(P)-dependent oxidoreductase [Planctomycetota bacterium]
MYVPPGYRVLITGASSGLGAMMAKLLGADKARVAITGRRADRLEKVAEAVRAAGGTPMILTGDTSSPEDAQRHVETINQAWGGIDWVILNAGVGLHTPGHKFKAADFKYTFDVNLMGPCYYLEHIIPIMLKQKKGTIAGVSSLAAFRGLPETGAYSASKAGLMTLLESLRVDLSRKGIRVVSVNPGFVKSEMTAQNDPGQMLFLMETEAGARCMLSGIKRGKRIVHFPKRLSLFVKYVLGNMPGFIYDFGVRRIGRRKSPPGTVFGDWNKAAATSPEKTI